MLPLHICDVHTSRTRLIAIQPEMLRSEQARNGKLGELIGCAIPANWPPEHWEPHVFEVLLRQYERCPQQVSWHRYVALLRPDAEPLLIGALGAFWRETAPAECEIGYSIVPPHEGLGLATEAAQALIEIIRRDVGITSVVAHTFAEHAGSLRVMEKCGLRFEGPGEEPGTVRYRLRLREGEQRLTSG